MQIRISAAILAGGPGRRMKGLVKSNILIDGQTIISRSIATVKDLFDEVLIITNTPEEFNKYSGCRIVRDHYINKGPLGGVHAALKASLYEAVFVIAGDMPLLNSNLIIRQINTFRKNKFDILVPKINNTIEPLHSILKKSLLQQLDVYLSGDNDIAVREFFKLVNTNYMELDDNDETRNIFSNINFQSDIAVIERILKGV